MTLTTVADKLRIGQAKGFCPLLLIAGEIAHPVG